MKLWLSRNSAIPIQQQLKTQLMLGIVSGDLAAGEKLPSTHEIARRFRLHANTVRAVYRDLVKGQWAEWRRGSGFYVRKAPATRAGADPLDNMISVFLEMAQTGGYSLTEVRRRMLDRIETRPPDHILVVEPDPDLRAILIAEIGAATGTRTEGVGLGAKLKSETPAGAIAVVLPDHVDSACAALPPDMPLLALTSRSIPSNLAGQTRPSEATPITIISGWPDFLRWAQIILTGVGLDPAAFDIRDTHDAGWERGLTRHNFIVTDALTAACLPRDCKPKVFAIVSDQSMAGLKDSLSPQAV